MHGGFRLGAVPELTHDIYHGPYTGALWDLFSSSTILLAANAVLQLTHDNDINVLAGYSERTGAIVAETRFDHARAVATNGAGTLYVAEHSGRFFKLELPVAFQGTWPQRRSGSGQPGPDDVVVGTRLPFRAASKVYGIAYVPASNNCFGNCANSNCLVFTTSTAVYRVALGGAGGEASIGEPVLWAGCEGEWGRRDGVAERARFHNLGGVVVDAEGYAFVADDWSESLAVRKVSPSGEVTTVTSALCAESILPDPGILPNGCLVLAGSRLSFVDLKLKPVPLCASAVVAVPTRPPSRTLSSDLGALLDGQHGDTSDLKLLVGDRNFAVHRGILVARSDYFRQRLEGGFADGSSTQLSLPEADPEAFAVVLRFMYTGAADIPAALAASVAALADRLLLPELCQAAQSRVLAEVQPETVVERLLWAEARGPSFSQLLSDLKNWYLEHHEEVVSGAADSVQRLMEERSSLAMELYVFGKRLRVT